MKIRAYIIFLLCLFQLSIYAQQTAQVTLSIRLYPIQTMEVVPTDAQIMDLSNENTTNPLPSTQLSTFSTSSHTTCVDSVKNKCFEALQGVKELSPQEHKSINQIFSDQSNYYKNDEEYDVGLNVVYCMETL